MPTEQESGELEREDVTSLVAVLHRYGKTLGDIAFYPKCPETSARPDGFEAAQRKNIREAESALRAWTECPALAPVLGAVGYNLRDFALRFNSSVGDVRDLITLLSRNDRWGHCADDWGSADDRDIADRVANAARWFRDLADAVSLPVDQATVEPETPPEIPASGPARSGKGMLTFPRLSDARLRLFVHFCKKLHRRIGPFEGQADKILHRVFNSRADFEPDLARAAREAILTARTLRDSFDSLPRATYPTTFRNRVKAYADIVERLVDRWGWGFILEPDAEERIKAATDRHREARYLPLMRLALAWQAMPEAVLPDRFNQLADEASDKGMDPAELPEGTTPEEAERLTFEAHDEWRDSSALGENPPVYTVEDRSDLREIGWELLVDLERVIRENEPAALEAEPTPPVDPTPEVSPPVVDQAAAPAPEAASLNAMTEVGNGQSSTSRESVCPIILGGERDEPLVYGKAKKPLSPARYSVVKALVDAYPSRLSITQLKNRSNNDYPVKRLDAVRKLDADWKAVIDKPGQAHVGYGLNPERPKKGRNG